MLEDILKELDDVLEEITSTNEYILDQLQDPVEHELALKYMVRKPYEVRKPPKCYGQDKVTPTASC